MVFVSTSPHRRVSRSAVIYHPNRTKPAASLAEGSRETRLIMSDRTNVLHVTDLHFGFEPADSHGTTALAHREHTLDQLLITLNSLQDDLKPDVVALSGDVGWKGTASDYARAATWIKQLLHNLGLTADSLVVCPGNHDIDRRATMGMPPPLTAELADDYLRPENLENFMRPFTDFSEFLASLGVPRLRLGVTDYAFLGHRMLGGLRFVCLNSAWFCRGEEDRGRLWIGLPQLEVMQSSGQLSAIPSYDSDPITVALVHHPSSWLHDSESNSYGERPNTYHLLAQGSHIILSGHVHGAPEEPTRASNHAYVFTTGAGYVTARYRNNFSILQVDRRQRTVTQHCFEYDPRYKHWKGVESKRSYGLRVREHEFGSASRSPPSLPEYDYKRLIEKCREYCLRYAELKSRAVRRHGVLPKLIRRPVLLHRREERLGIGRDRSVKLAASLVSSFDESVCSDRPTFLFGDLGSGKSTVCSEYAIGLADRASGVIPILVPASYFLGKDVRTIGVVLDHVSAFVNEQVNPCSQRFDIQDTVEQGHEVGLLVDGVDELDNPTAKKLLVRLEEATAHWAHLRIIATGRPIEISDLDYRYWNCVQLAPLTVEDQHQLLLHEAEADGLDDTTASDQARDRLRALQDSPELLAIADTPLAVRLLCPFLGQGGDRRTLGDLLHSVLDQRLADWASRDRKEEHLTHFAQAFPDLMTRRRLAGTIAAEIHRRADRALPRAALHTLLHAATPKVCVSPRSIAETVEFLENSLLISEGDDRLAFPSQPLLQCALGCHIAFGVVSGDGPEELGDPPEALWREWSFAAAAARRWGGMEEASSRLGQYLETFYNVRPLSPAVAFIISESGDSTLALEYVRSLPRFGLRPLFVFGDVRSYSTVSIAHCLRLAGADGFSWFFSAYLDPRYPLTSSSSECRVAAEVLFHWLATSDFEVTRDEADLLKGIPGPHLATHSWAAHELLPVVAMAIPEAFEQRLRVRLYAEGLSSALLSSKCRDLLRREAVQSGPAEVQGALSAVCYQGFEGSPAAALLWLEVCSGPPPLEVIHAAVRAFPRYGNTEPLSAVEERIGSQSLMALLRWYALGDLTLGEGAAARLWELGERNHILLGPGLIEGLDGDSGERSESALWSVLSETGTDGLLWMTNELAHQRERHRVRPGVWRLFIRTLIERADGTPGHLRHVLPTLDEYSLARSPELRQSLSRLMAGKPEYREMLQQALTSTGNETRFNAATILFACYPSEEPRAVEIVVRAAVLPFKRGEWLSFCRKLDLGDDVTAYLASRLDTFTAVPRVFALLLLHHNGHELNDACFRELVLGLLGDAKGLDSGWWRQEGNEPEHVLGTQRALPVLIDALNGSEKIRREASETLWRYHKPSLDTRLYARCWPWLGDGVSAWDTRRWEDEEERIRGDKALRKRLRAECRAAQKEGLRPIPCVFLAALRQPSDWKDLLWLSMFGGERHWSDIQFEHAIDWMADRARLSPALGKVLGSAAAEFLRHQGLGSEARAPHLIPRLAFLAHEFGTLEAGRLAEAILACSRNVSQDIAAALIARLGSVPPDYTPQERFLLFGSNVGSSPISAPTRTSVIEVTRDTTAPSDAIAVVAEQVLASGGLSDEDLAAIAHESEFGSLLALIVRACRDIPYDDWAVVTALGLTTEKLGEGHPSQTLVRVVSRLGTMRAYAPDRGRYFDVIRERLKDSEDSHGGILFTELLRHGQDVPAGLLNNQLARICERSYYLTWELTHYLSNLFAIGLKDSDRAEIIRHLEALMSTLAVESDDHPSHSDGPRALLFALALLALTGVATDDARRLLLNGLRDVVVRGNQTRYDGQPGPSVFAHDVLVALRPLFHAVPRNSLREVLVWGLESDSEQIRACCTALLAFSGSYPQHTQAGS